MNEEQRFQGVRYYTLRRPDDRVSGKRRNRNKRQAEGQEQSGLRSEFNVKKSANPVVQLSHLYEPKCFLPF
jgi:hypothetical protein